jgi:hypothetical protein
MNRRIFLRTASAVAALAVVAPRDALARVTPPDEPDYAEAIQQQLDRGEAVHIEGGRFTLRRTITVGPGGRLELHHSHVTATGRGAIRFLHDPHWIRGDPPRHHISHCFFEFKPTLLARLLNRFA